MDDDFVMKMLTVKDIYTNFIGAYPVDTRSEVNVRPSNSSWEVERSSCCVVTTLKSSRGLPKRLRSHSITPSLTANKPMPFLLRGPISILRIK